MASASWNTSFAVSDVAAQMWRALLRCANEEDAAEEVAQAYGVAVSQVRANFEAFVVGLLEKGALVRCPA
ncbi:MAG: PqqD family protein [Trueperaceae bacterium]